MDDLPNEMLLEIFLRLPVDQMLLCKQVCKRWFALIDSMIHPSSLVIHDRYYSPILCKWFATNEFVYDHLYRISSRSQEVLKFRAHQPMFDHLKSLYIRCRAIEINSINCLHRLEILELISCNHKRGKPIEIRLSNLRVLNLEKVKSSMPELTIDAPKLERFRYEKTFFGNVIVKHPESIKEFYSFFISYDRTAVWLDFVNLEHLYCKKYLHNEQLLLRLKHLKTFHVNVYSGNMNYFKMQKAALGLNNPQIYFQGVHLDALPLYSEVPFGWNKFGTRLDADTIEFHGFNHFQFVDQPYCMRMVDWYLLESYFEEHHFAGAPIELVRRFVRLDELELSGEPRDPEQLASLLRHCKYLPSLKVTASFMSQNFFDEILSEHCPVIGSLSIQNENQLNFDFLLKFKDLQNLTTDQLLSTDLVAKMYDRFEYLNTLRFRFKGSSVEIRFYERTTFRLLLNKTRHLFDSLASLLEFLELNHNQEPLNIEENLDNFIIRSF